MNSVRSGCLVATIFALGLSGVARADTLQGVITDYESGNQGTNMTVRTSDGRSHVLWFDNMKKPLFEGKPLPWCPDMPCDGWPKALILKKTRVTVYTFKQTVDGKVVETPTKAVLLR